MGNYQITIDITKCVGCSICEMACSLYNKGECNPEKSMIRVVRYEDGGMMYSVPVVCQQCEKPLCQEICPFRAISRDLKTCALVVDESKCIGCRYCINVCPFGAMSFDKDTRSTVKCNLCGGEPKCVELCPTGALFFASTDKVNMRKKREGIDRYLKNLNIGF